MTGRMLRQPDNLKLLYKCSSLQRKVLLKSANSALGLHYQYHSPENPYHN